ncbi:MAG TPA: laminin B domain-containing protein [Aquaticitalea sp.]|nr:laminin B domain-containing protein [Aquaticitalea sp.]
MKTITKFIYVVFLAVAVLSCSKDDDTQAVYSLDDLQGKWYRAYSNNPSADGMEVTVTGNRGEVTDPANTSFTMNSIKWNEIIATAQNLFQHEELGSDGNYYDGFMELEQDTLRISVGHSGVGNAQKWVRTYTEPGGPLVQDTFAEDEAGWTIIGDAQGGYVAASYSPDGGVTDGYIYADDDVLGGVWYFNAPDSYTGNRLEFYGASLTFSQFQDCDMSDQIEAADIVFSNGEQKITYQHGENNYPNVEWTNYNIPINADSGWIKGDYDSGILATEAEIKAVLANVTQFIIRGEFESGPDTGGLDNVMID